MPNFFQFEKIKKDFINLKADFSYMQEDNKKMKE